MSEMAEMIEKEKERQAKQEKAKHAIEWATASFKSKRRRLKKAMGLHGKRKSKYKVLNQYMKKMGV